MVTKREDRGVSGPTTQLRCGVASQPEAGRDQPNDAFLGRSTCIWSLGPVSVCLRIPRGVALQRGSSWSPPVRPSLQAPPLAEGSAGLGDSGRGHRAAENNGDANGKQILSRALPPLARESESRELAFSVNECKMQFCFRYGPSAWSSLLLQTGLNVARECHLLTQHRRGRRAPSVGPS